MKVNDFSGRHQNPLQAMATPVSELDWTLLGHELRQNDEDAHGPDHLYGVMGAYGFLLDNPECFTGGQNGWPEDMPLDPPLELVLGYTYWMERKP